MKAVWFDAIVARRARVRALTLLAAIAAATAGAAACGGKEPTPPVTDDPFNGTFRLDAIADKGLPFDYYCFGASCETLLSSRVETMEQNKLRDIMEFRPGPGASPIVDTMISTYTIDGTRVIFNRSPVGGSRSTYADTGFVDAGGHLVMKPHLIQSRSNSRNFLYTRQ